MFRPTQIRNYLAWMQNKGFSSPEVLNGSGIDEHKLEDKDYLIDIWQTQQVITNMKTLTGDEELGFHIAKDIKFSDLGIMGYAIMSAKNMREFAALWNTFSHSLIGELINIEVGEGDGYWTCEFRESVPLDNLLTFCMEEIFMLGILVGEAATQTQFEFLSLELSFPPPSYHERYSEIMNCPVHFNSTKTIVKIKSPALDAPIQHNDEELHQVCLQHCQQIMQQITEGRPLAFKIRHLMLQHSGETLSLQETADALHMSTRSLRRHLQQEGVSYQELVNQFRADLACQYMAQSKLSNQEIGYLLGYQDTKAFLRAFKGWTGQTVTDYRATLPA